MIQVTDFNDNHPVFFVPEGGYTAVLPENATNGTQVLTVEATDFDQGANQHITYSIDDPAITNFEIGLMV